MRTTKAKRQSINKELAQKILANVPYEKGFHFFMSLGKYTGETSINLLSFYEELRSIELSSVRFHMQRNDYQNWIRDSLGDNELADRVNNIGTKLADEDLRKALREVVATRIQELQTTAKN